ncbi:MAG TPA: amidohydrolase family protein [Acidimicrobiia bacterium]|jgi:N-acyl-D-aspartate/D-glutamate deacylase|nr:amidohydrolase family protein [Acidimicrobiia bacterium]
MLDCVIKGGSVVDGTGAPARQADVGVRGGRIVEIGTINEDATETIDAGGLVVAPGIVDPHTHYDAQLFWDPAASPSNLHGVTSMIAGNCGFTLAPIAPVDADYLRRMMAKVEGMPLPALETGVPWNWRSFGDYLGALDGNIGLNVGFLVGHCALRRNVMGADSIGNEATPEQLDSMLALLHDSISAGGLGFSTTLSFTHSDGDGQPVASRWASNDEVLALCRAVSEHEGTTLEYVTDGCLRGFSDAEIDLMAEMTLAGRRPLNWNVLTIDSAEPRRYHDQVAACENARARGGTAIALTMPILVEMNMSFLTYCALFMLPGWSEVMSLPVPERIAKLRDPEVRRWMDERAHSREAGVFSRLASWGQYLIGDTYSAANEGLKGQVVADLAQRSGKSAFDTLVDTVINDDLRTVLWPLPSDSDPKSWQLRAEAWDHPLVMIGGSDAGAHLDRMCGAPYPTKFLGDCIRGRQLVSMERCVQLMTQIPAALFGLRDRGLVREGFHADLFVFDAETVDTGEVKLVDDLPGGTSRLFADASGVHRVIVNGTTVVADGTPIDARPGTVLRSGRDTYTVPIPADA